MVIFPLGSGWAVQHDFLLTTSFTIFYDKVFKTFGGYLRHFRRPSMAIYDTLHDLSWLDDIFISIASRGRIALRYLHFDHIYLY